MYPYFSFDSLEIACVYRLGLCPYLVWISSLNYSYFWEYEFFSLFILLFSWQNGVCAKLALEFLLFNLGLWNWYCCVDDIGCFSYIFEINVCDAYFLSNWRWKSERSKNRRSFDSNVLWVGGFFIICYTKSSAPVGIWGIWFLCQGCSYAIHIIENAESSSYIFEFCQYVV